MSASKILLVEDDELDVISFERTLKKLNIDFDLIIAHNGKEALTLLNDPEKPLMPDVILLDLNMPKTHGHEALAYIKANVKLRIVPVIVLSVSRRPVDNEKSMLLGAAGFFSKPNREDQWHPIVRAIVAAVHANEHDTVA